MTEHGTLSAYKHGRCRCDLCRAANAAAFRKARDRRRAYSKEQIPHGVGGYNNYACRCETCTAAKSADIGGRRAKNAGSASTPHGTLTGYTFYLCRCSACRGASREWNREYRARKREVSR